MLSKRIWISSVCSSQCFFWWVWFRKLEGFLKNREGNRYGYAQIAVLVTNFSRFVLNPFRFSCSICLYQWKFPWKIGSFCCFVDYEITQISKIYFCCFFWYGLCWDSNIVTKFSRFVLNPFRFCFSICLYQWKSHERLDLLLLFWLWNYPKSAVSFSAIVWCIIVLSFSSLWIFKYQMALCSIYKYGSKAQGLAFLAFGSISFLVFVYVAIVSKLLPPFDNPILAAIQNDRWLSLCSILSSFCYLVKLAYAWLYW